MMMERVKEWGSVREKKVKEKEKRKRREKKGVALCLKLPHKGSFAPLIQMDMF